MSIHSIHIGIGHGEALSCARDKVGKHTSGSAIRVIFHSLMF